MIMELVAPIKSQRLYLIVGTSYKLAPAEVQIYEIILTPQKINITANVRILIENILLERKKNVHLPIF